MSVDANHSYKFIYNRKPHQSYTIIVEYDPLTATVLDIKKLIAKQLGYKPENIKMFGRLNFSAICKDDEIFERKPWKLENSPAWISVIEPKKEEKKA